MLKYFYCLLTIQTICACTSVSTLQNGKQHPNTIVTVGDKTIIQGHVVYNTVVSFLNEVVIMPQAFIQTVGDGQVIFQGPISIVGDSHIFDPSVNISFGKGTISQLNPVWFGANGTDEIDDTPAFIRTVELSQQILNSVNILIPIGKFRITKTLLLKNRVANERSINLIGTSIGGNSISGSCLQWHGPPDASMVIISNNVNTRIENIEFACYSTTTLKHNVELLPFINQLNFVNCFFSGCSGPESANVNINRGNNAQVSEISFENCSFRGFTIDNINWLTESAVIGGLANTKNFYFDKCSFIGYTEAAINIDLSDILHVNKCTFSVNEIDIVCNLCNSLISSNYSEQSYSFFKSGISSNMAFTTIMNNYFDGHPKNDYVIREGSGNLLMINNSFGGTGNYDAVNKINWSENRQSSITSLSNFYRNNQILESPFVSDQSRIRRSHIISINDLLGQSGSDFKRLIIKEE